MYKLYNSFFVLFGKFVIWGFWDFYINIYYTCRSLTRVGFYISDFGNRPPFRATFSGMLKVVVREPPFRDQPYVRTILAPKPTS